MDHHTQPRQLPRPGPQPPQLPRARRLGRLIALAALAAAALAGDAAAHGGTVIGSGANDAYAMTLQAADVRTSDGGQAVDLTAYPIRRANGAPETDAALTFRIDGGPELAGRLSLGAYDVVVPVARAGAWRDWSVTATVTGAAGTLTVRRAPGAAPAAEAPGWIVPAAVGCAVAALALVLGRRRAARRRSTTS